MPPASRGVLALRVFRRCAHSMRMPPRPITDVHPKQKPQRSLASRWQEQTSLRDAKGQRPPPQDPEPEPSSDAHKPGVIPPRVRYAWRWFKRFFLIASPLALLAVHFPLEPMWVTGASMSPLLNVNSSPDLPQTSDVILVQKVMFPERGIWGFKVPALHVKRGQIVVFYAPHNPNKLAVKRVVGVPGDRVQPLAGYPGGDEPVVVPYNHIWVEGDVNQREKSVDSNWYGPISQNLVVGVVKAVLTPWYSPVKVKWEEHKYPAKENDRVEENVVHDATVDPDKMHLTEVFRNGTAERELNALKVNRERISPLLKNESNRTKLTVMYAQAKEEFEKSDPETIDVASHLVQELEKVFSAAGLSKTGQPIRLLPAPAQEQQE